VSEIEVIKDLLNAKLPGLKMSEFHCGKYKNEIYKTYPLGWFGKRKPKIFWHLPYWTAQKVTFNIEVDSSDKKNLISEIPIFSKNSDSSLEGNRIEEGNDCILSEDGKQVTIITDGLRGSSILKYYLGSPSSKDSEIIVELQANWRDKKWFIVYGLIGGFAGSLIIFILGLILQFIKINPH
jgi:hypothetical protein